MQSGRPRPALLSLSTLAIAGVVGCAGIIGCGESAAPPRTEHSVEVSAPSSNRPGEGTIDATALLKEAALAGQTELVRKALDRGADPGTAGEDGRTALMLAAFDGHSDTTRLLLERGAKVGDRDGAGRTALMYAASGPNPGTVRLLLEWKADPIAADHEEQFTALMFAAAEGHADVVRTLLEHGSDPSLVDIDGDTALDFAIQNGHMGVARLFGVSDSEGLPDDR